MRKLRTSIQRPPTATSASRFLGTHLLTIVLLFSSLPLTPVVLAGHPTRPEVASPQPQETPEPTPTPSEEELKLKEQKRLLDLQKEIEINKQAIAEAQKAQLEAKFPKATTSPLTGETKINDSAVIESDMVSYLSMAYAANRLVTQLRPLSPSNLAIHNATDINLLLNYNVTTNQLDIMKQNYCSVLASDLHPDVCPAPSPSATPCPSPQPKARSAARAIPLAVSAATSFLGAFVDLTALLRTNVEIKGHTFDIEEVVLVSEVFRAARAADGLYNNGNPKNKTSLYYPAAFPPLLNVHTNSELLRKLEILRLLKADVDELIGNLKAVDAKISKAEAKAEDLEAKLKVVQRRISDLGGERDRLAEDLKHILSASKHDEIIVRIHELKDLIRELQAEEVKIRDKEIPENETKLEKLITQRDELLQELQLNVRPKRNLDGTVDLGPVITRIKAINEQFEKFIDSLIKTDASSGVNSLTAYLKAENINGALNDLNSYWLQLKVVKAGGNNKIKTNLITDIFTAGARVSHSGGAIVQYILYDRNGRVVSSDTFTEYTGYIKANKIKRLINPTAVADIPPRTLKHPQD